MGVERMIADQENKSFYHKGHEGSQRKTSNNAALGHGIKAEAHQSHQQKPVVSLYFPDPWIIRANPR
jgi:hypothetical protein